MATELSPAVRQQGSVSPWHDNHLEDLGEAMRNTLAWLEELLQIEAPGGRFVFADCWLLGRVADVLRASLRGQVPAHRPPPPPSMQRAFRDRINDYNRMQQLCVDLGLPPDWLPPLADVEAGQGGAAICSCLYSVAEKCAALGLPVPEFGGGEARASLRRRSRSQEASARLLETFRSIGDSPPKLPSGQHLTPRAFLTKPPPSNSGRSLSSRLSSGSSPTATTDSDGSLREWLDDGTSVQSGQAAAGQLRAPPAGSGQRGAAGSLGLGRTVAAMERAAAAAAGQQEAQVAPAPAPRRPALPPLDMAAAARRSAASTPSALSSPPSSFSSPAAGGGGYSSDSYLSSCSSPDLDSSPAHNRLTPTGLQERARGNPLWRSQSRSQSRSATPPQPGYQAQAAAALPAAAAEPAPEPAAAAAAGDGGLLESILSPPHLKPTHSRLLGSLMHTAAASSQPEEAAVDQPTWHDAQQGGPERSERSGLPLALLGAAAAGVAALLGAALARGGAGRQHPAQQQQQQQQQRPAPGQQKRSGRPGQGRRVGTVSWDSPHAVTRG